MHHTRSSNLPANGIRPRAFCLVLALFLPLLAHAAPVMVGDVEIDPQSFSPSQDPQIRVAPCLACHGKHAGGDSDFGPDVRFGTPALRGMRREYLAQSLIDYKTGKRAHEEMEVIAAMLDEQTIDFMARTFAAYPAATTITADARARLADTDPLFRKGQEIAQRGVPDQGVPACLACHGALGEGNAQLGPRLAGQNGIYIRQQLAAYAESTRRTAQAAIMQPVASGLSSAGAEAVAHYYERLVHLEQP